MRDWWCEGCDGDFSTGKALQDVAAHRSRFETTQAPLFLIPSQKTALNVATGRQPGVTFSNLLGRPAPPACRPYIEPTQSAHTGRRGQIAMLPDSSMPDE